MFRDRAAFFLNVGRATICRSAWTVHRGGHDWRTGLARHWRAPSHHRAIPEHSAQYVRGRSWLDQSAPVSQSCGKCIREGNALAGEERTDRTVLQLRARNSPRASGRRSIRALIAIIEEPVHEYCRTPHLDSIGRPVSNELTLARQGSRESCIAASLLPQVTVAVSPAPDLFQLSAGSRGSCPGRYADQSIWELTDNVSWPLGSHVLTIGTHDEAIHLDGSRRIRVPAGSWDFSSLDSLEAGAPDKYTRDIGIDGTQSGPPSDYGVRQLGLYAQDQWRPLPHLTLTAGLRFDVPFLSNSPAQNTQLLSSLGVNTSVTPSGHLLWSPRIGFTYGLGQNGQTASIRGSAGLYAGRPIFLYFSNVFETTGLAYQQLHCIGEAEIPSFTLDPDNQPTSCANGAPAREFEVNYFSPTFRFPRNLRLTLGSNVSLPWEMVGTIDLLYIRGVNQFDIVDVNLAKPTARLRRRGGARVIWNHRR